MASWLALDPGHQVNVTGQVVAGDTSGYGTDPECHIVAESIGVTGVVAVPAPLGLNGRTTAGGAFGLQPALFLDALADPDKEGAGLSAVGIRVKVWGLLTSSGESSDPNVSWMFLYDDYLSGLRRMYDGQGRDGIRVIYPTSPSEYGDSIRQEESIYVATGILGAEMSGDDPPRAVPVLRIPRPRPVSCVKYVKWDSPYNGPGNDWEHAYHTVQQGIDAAYAANPKCEVWVAAGTYYVNDPNNQPGPVTLMEGVAIYGGFAGTETRRDQRNWNTNVTTLDGSLGGPVVEASSSGTATRIDGFTILHGYSGVVLYASSATVANNTIKDNATSYLYGYDGAGMYCAGGSPTIWSNTISGNTAIYRGGGISCNYYCDAVILNNTICENTAGSGGGIHCLESSPVISNNTITGNVADGGLPVGGGMYAEEYSSPTITRNTIGPAEAPNRATNGAGIACLYWGSPVIADNEIRYNLATSKGGGIYCYATSAQILNNRIEDNSAGASVNQYGGGICTSERATPEPEIRGNVLSRNQAYEGGGIAAFYDSSPLILGNRFDSNLAVDHGGGFAGHGGFHRALLNNLFVSNRVTGQGARGGGAIQLWGSTADVINNTFVDNDAGTGRGGAVLVRADGGAASAVLTNNIFCNNTSQFPQGNSVAVIWSGSASISYCDAYPGAGENYFDFDTGLSIPASYSIFAEPLFADQEYRLALAPNPSPGIDVALNPDQTAYAAELAHDRDGQERPVDIPGVGNPDTSNAYADMGAYETPQL